MRREPLLAALALFLLMAGCVIVMKPFFSALMWAIILSYMLAPMQRMFTRWFRGARTLAACVVALIVAVLFTGPIVLVGMSLAEDGRELAVTTRDWFMTAPEQAPGWVSGVPVLGDELSGYWKKFAEDRNRWMTILDEQVKTGQQNDQADGDASPASGSAASSEADDASSPKSTAAFPAPDRIPDWAGGRALRAQLGMDESLVEKEADSSPQLIVLAGKFLNWARGWLLSSAKAVGNGVAQVLFSAFLAFFLLRDAPELSRRLSIAVERLAGERGQRLIKVAGDTVRGVIFGILGTALAQALVAGLGFWIAGVPGVVLLSVLTFFFAVIPYGPPLIWVPAGIWLISQDKIGMGIFMLIWGAGFISMVDNFLRPFLISQGSKTPFALVFCGVIGGALAFGLVGVFLGPILLAVGFRLIAEWTSQPQLQLSGSVATHKAKLPDSGEPCP